MWQSERNKMWNYCSLKLKSIHNLKNLQLQLQYIYNMSEIFFEGCIRRFPEREKISSFHSKFIFILLIQLCRCSPTPSHVPLSNVKIARVSFLFLWEASSVSWLVDAIACRREWCIIQIVYKFLWKKECFLFIIIIILFGMRECKHKSKISELKN